MGIDFHEKCSREFFGTPKPPKLDFPLDEMSTLAQQVVQRSVAVPGVQAKLSLSVIEKTKEHSDTRLTVTDALGGNYIFKPPAEDYPEMPQNEHATMRMADAFGIKVAPSSLIRLKSGELSYITKRMDRTPNGDKIHMIDMFQTLEAFDKYRSSMEKVGKAIGKYSSNTLLDKLSFFELAVFSFLTGNNDMHLKNFSMIEGVSGWTLAPAYDLLNVTILLPEDTEELALTIAGKKKKLQLEHFLTFGEGLGLTPKQIQGVFKRFKKHLPNTNRGLENSFLSNEMKESYRQVIKEKGDRLGLLMI